MSNYLIKSQGDSVSIKPEPNLKHSFVKVKDLLQKNLMIPTYQRPYKWSTKNVNQLIGDIIENTEKQTYRLGTIVLHRDKTLLNIVDGQQRTVTLLLIVQAILTSRKKELENPELISLLDNLKLHLFNPTFTNDISKNNIFHNYKEIQRAVASMEEKSINFLLNKCEFNEFVLEDISEAFQFFDSQNARGKDLEPHDLLKAFHLREFSKKDEGSKSEIIENWENMKTKDLSNLFAQYLFRIRGWSKGNSSRIFGKDETSLFKGVNMEEGEAFPYTRFYRIAHHYIDHFNSSFERKIDQQITSYPFQLDQTIINGRRFFEMIGHYKAIFDKVNQEIKETDNLSATATLILKTIDNYPSRERIGDQYVRTLFNASLIFYYDKFGFKDFSRAVEKIFIWAYTLRLEQHSVQFASVDNYVLKSSNLFKSISEATVPTEVLDIYLRPVYKKKSTKTAELENIFQNLKYLHS